MFGSPANPSRYYNIGLLQTADTATKLHFVNIRRGQPGPTHSTVLIKQNPLSPLRTLELEPPSWSVPLDKEGSRSD